MRKWRTEEQETTFTIEGAKRKVVRVGTKVVESMEDGGKFYALPANQVCLTKPPTPLTDAPRAALARRLRNGRESKSKKPGYFTDCWANSASFGVKNLFG